MTDSTLVRLQPRPAAVATSTSSKKYRIVQRHVSEDKANRSRLPVTQQEFNNRRLTQQR